MWNVAAGMKTLEYLQVELDVVGCSQVGSIYLPSRNGDGLFRQEAVIVTLQVAKPHSEPARER